MLFRSSVFAAGTGGVAAEASARKEAARVSDAALSSAGVAGAQRVLLHSVFASELPEGDADGGGDSAGWGAGVFGAVCSDEGSGLTYPPPRYFLRKVFDSDELGLDLLSCMG